MATRMVTGFLVLPFLVNQLGMTGYGLWSLIAASTGAFALLDLGTRGSLGRNVAYARAKGDHQEINVLLSSGLAVTGTAAVVAALATLFFVPVFVLLFDPPADQLREVYLALPIAGLSIAATLALSVFDATLWAYQRFEVINLVDIIGSIARIVLTFKLVTATNGLVTLALLQLGISLGGDLIKGLACAWLIPELRPRPWLVQRGALEVLFNYGVWNFVGGIGRSITEGSGPMIVGNRLGLEMVTPFAAAWRLLGYAVQVMSVGADVITPVATTLHAQEKSNQQQQLFLEGSKFAFALGLFFLGGFACLGRSFLGLWIGPAFASAASLLFILMLGEVLPMSQIITRSIILGMGKPRIVALLVIAENCLAIPLALLAARPFGLVGVCVVIAVAATCCRGIGLVLAGSRLVRLPPWHVPLHSFLPALLCGLPPILLLALGVDLVPPTRWLGLVGWSVAYGLVYAAFVAGLLIGWGPLSRRLSSRFDFLLGRRLWEPSDLGSDRVADRGPEVGPEVVSQP